MTELNDIKGVSGSRADNLREEGFTTVDDVANATETALVEVDGIGNATAPDLIQEARDVIRGTVDEPEPEEETLNTEPGDVGDSTESEEEEFPDLEPTEDDEDVTVEDLEELNGEEPDGDPDSEVTAQDDTGEPEEVEVTVNENEVTLSLDSDEQFDYLIYALLDMRIGRITITHEQDSIAENILGEVRGFGGAGEVTLTLTDSELNALHALLTQTATAYQGESAVEAFNAVRAIKEQVQEAREEYVL